MDPLSTVFIVIVIVFSAIIHEVMHGVAADKLGDPTARYAGRLTLNPVPHIDPIGSIILPIFFVISHSPVFLAWAKPVPYNPYNLKPGRFSEAIVAFAGPLSNIAIAILAGVLLRLQLFNPLMGTALYTIVLVNVSLAIFNIVPIPPLDGSKVLEAILPRALQNGYGEWRRRLEMNPIFGMLLVLLFIYVFGGVFGTVVYTVAGAITGIST